MESLAFAITITVAFSVLAFWSMYAPFFMITGGAAFMAGLKVFDVYTDDTGLAIGLCLIGYAFVAMFFAFKYIFYYSAGEED